MPAASHARGAATRAFAAEAVRRRPAAGPIALGRAGQLSVISNAMPMLPSSYNADLVSKFAEHARTTRAGH